MLVLVLPCAYSICTHFARSRCRQHKVLRRSLSPGCHLCRARCSSLMYVSRCRALCVLRAACLVVAAAAAAAVASAEMYDCSQHEQPRDQEGLEKCLPRLKVQPDAFRNCTSQLCFIFLRDAPFVLLDDVLDDNGNKVFNAKDPIEEQIKVQTLFKCSEPESAFPGLKGVAFDLLKQVAGDALCVYGGDTCTFNNLVDFTRVKADDGYMFGITGLLLETEERHCFHEAGSPIIDNSMVIIGQNNQDNAPSKGAIFSLQKPFEPATWAILGGTILAFVVACVAITIRFSYRGRSLITAFFIFAGERDEAIAHENELHPGRYQGQNLYGPDSPASQANLSFATKYGLSMALFRIALLAFLGVFCLFYEVAVVNFLFQQQQTLDIGKSVKKLSRKELEKYSVLKDSALEDVWVRLVNPDGRKFNISDKGSYPWRRCDIGVECLEWAEDASNQGTVYDVSYDTFGRYLIDTNSNCDKLTIFKTKDVLYQFNAGWLYNRKVNSTRRGEIDREIVKLRINGEIRNVVNKYIEDFDCDATPKTDIGPMIVLIPILLFVFPPLLFSVLVLLFWKKKKERAKRNKALEENDVSDSNEMFHA